MSNIAISLDVKIFGSYLTSKENKTQIHFEIQNKAPSPKELTPPRREDNM